MRIVRCENKNCKHNNGMFCVLESIEIDDKGNCKCFEERIEFEGNIEIKCKCGHKISLEFNDLESEILKRCPACENKILVRIDAKYT